MTFRFIPFPIFLLLTVSVNAQQFVGTISGQVTSEASAALKSATARLYKIASKDSTLSRTAVTEQDGKFAFQVADTGAFRVRVSMLGYQDHNSLTIYISDKNETIILPAIALKKSPQALKEVVISGKKPFIEQKIDRTVVNVDAIISNTGTNALEVLEKSPGVTVDQNGTISLKGKSGVVVYIDNRPTYLSAADLASYLKSLPSSSISQIELITNPPARYDAAGNAGIINIKTKKNLAKGFNGTVSTSLARGVYWRNNESINLGYRVNKFNLFGNAGYNIQKSWRQLDINRRNYLDDGSLNSTFTQTSLFNPESKSPNFKIGADFYASSKTTLGVVVTGSSSVTEEYRPVNSELFSIAGTRDSMINANNNSENDFRNRGVNLNLSHQFDSTGTSSLNFDADYVKYNSGADQSFINTTRLDDNSLRRFENLRAALPSSVNIYSAKADYNRPLKGKAKFETGVKSSYVSTDNSAEYFNVVNGLESVDFDKTNRFKFRENINSAYVNFNIELKRFSFQSGLRFENTNGEGHQLGNAIKPDSTFSKNYNSLFPTAYVSYKIDSAGKNLLNFSFGRRIDRPYYQSLNPFIFLIDKFTYFSGNPFLRPQYTNNFELSFNHNNRLTVTAIYNRAADVFNEVIEQRNRVFISTTGNIGNRTNMGFSVNGTLKAGNWWTCNIYSEVINNRFKGTLPSGNLDAGSTYFSISPNSQFTLRKGWGAELSGFYISRSTYGQFAMASRWQAHAAVQKKVLSKKGTVKLAARDIFRTWQPRGNILNITNTDATFHNYLDTRVFTASFTYAFSKGVTAKKKRKTGGAGSEVDRVGN